MQCTGCGAPLSSLVCKYCKTKNTPKTNHQNTSSTEESEYDFEIDQLQKRIEAIESMPMPDEMKQMKIKVLEEKIFKLTK